MKTVNELLTALRIENLENAEKALSSVLPYELSETDKVMNDIESGVLTANTGRDNKDYIWYESESHEACIRIEDLECLSDDEIDKQFL